MVELGLIIATEPTNLVALGRFYALECDALVARREWTKLYANGIAWTKADPNAPSAWRALARGAFEEGALIEAINAFGRYLSLTKPTVADFTAYASLCLQGLYIEWAINSLDRAEALDPTYPQMLAQRALVLMYLGRFAEAEAYCRRCIAQKPDFVPVYSTLSRLRRGALDDADLKQLNELARNSDVYLDYRIAAIFAIANAHDARGEIDSAFAAYDAAHLLARERDAFERRSYDATQDAVRIQRTVDLWERLPEIPPVANAPRPIFIVGMPRSGTTLLESVLGAHSRVFACGERPAMRQILRWPTSLEQTPPQAYQQTLQDWARFYFRDLPDLGGADHFTDKHPRNFEAAGFITRLLPNAVIVHVRRDPVETCLSIYRQEFNKHWTFTHRLTDIAEYYVRYARLVANWQRVLPPEKFITIQYEDFVADFANAAPKLVQACGLEWEPQCLEFQKTQHPIATFSTVQARSAVALGNGRAQRYEKFLGPLIAALEAGGIDLRTGALKVGE
jgi:tetratricopeptide (TPR) repeat protein